MRISIIICTRNRCSELKRTIDALNAATVPPESKVEVIVADNGSTDETSLWLKGATCYGTNVINVSVPQGGKAVALNTAIEISTGDIIVLTDDDVRPQKEWLIHLTRPLQQGRCDAVAGQVLIAQHLQRPWMSSTHAAWLASTAYLDQARPETAVGANMAFSRQVLRIIPGFDPELGPGRLGLWEDTLFSMQLVRRGFKLVMEPKAVVEHHFTPDRLERRSFLARAMAEAKSSAYVSWHWRHENRSRGTLRLLHYRLLLVLKRLTRRDWLKPEGMPEWEINLVTGIGFEKQYRIERLRPPAYEKFGSTKLKSPLS